MLEAITQKPPLVPQIQKSSINVKPMISAESNALKNFLKTPTKNIIKSPYSSSKDE